MKPRREYDIAFVGLKPGKHEFEYEITDKFFVNYAPQDFSNCTATVKLVLEKTTGLMHLHFEVFGRINVACDRCNADLPLDIWDEFEMIIKMVDEPEAMNNNETDPDIFYISRGETILNVEQWMYDFLLLSIPLQKVCNFENMDGPHCNKKVKAILKKINQSEKPKENDIWKELKKISNLKN